MAEEKVFIQSKGPRIEALIDHAPGENGAIITHPHPQYGGNMNNNVVEAVVQAYREKEYTTLRFNFRGVGQSQGNYDQGVGEQEDVRAALVYIFKLGKSAIDLAGYSFGAWVNAQGLKTYDQIERLVMVSPPVNFMDFSFLDHNPRIKLVISGSEDDIAPPAMIKEMLPAWNPEAQFSIIKGADHFYWEKTGKIKRIIHSFLESKG